MVHTGNCVITCKRKCVTVQPAPTQSQHEARIRPLFIREELDYRFTQRHSWQAAIVSLHLLASCRHIALCHSLCLADRVHIHPCEVIVIDYTYAWWIRGDISPHLGTNARNEEQCSLVDKLN
jgi:hypothetical protein